MLRSLNTYSTYNAEDNKLKIPAFEVLTHLQDPSDLKKIHHLHQQSAILLLLGRSVGLQSIQIQIMKSEFRILQSNMKSENGSPF